MYNLNELATIITYLKHIILNILSLSIILIIIKCLNLPINGKFWKNIHSTHIIEFQHVLLQIAAHLKAGNIYKDY